MFKFTIEADSIEELQLKIDNWVEVKYNQKLLSQRHVHSLLQQAQPVDSDSDAEAVMDSFQHAQTSTVPHINPGPSPIVNSAPVNSGDDLDVRGLPYDARIHSAGKSKNQDGTWRYRRGVDPTLIEQVEKEISTIKSVASPLQNAPIPPVPSSPSPAAMPAFEAPAQPMAPPVQQQMPLAPPSMLAPPDQTQVPAQPEVARHPDAPAFASPTTDKMYEAFSNVDKGIVIPPGQKPAHTLQTFQNNLTEVLAQLINEKKINKEYVESLCKHFNVKYIWNVIGSGTQIRELYEAFAQYGFITKLD